MHDALPSPRRTRAKVVARCIRGKSGAGRGAYSDFGTRSVRRAPGRAGGRGTAPSAPPPAAPPCSSSRTYRGRRPSPTCAPRHSASAACCDHGHAPARRARRGRTRPAAKLYIGFPRCRFGMVARRWRGGVDLSSPVFLPPPIGDPSEVHLRLIILPFSPLFVTPPRWRLV